MSDPVQKARDSWAAQGKALPAWVLGLAEQCARSSQRRVADRMGISAAVVSNIIAAKYPGDMQGMEDRYRGAFEMETVRCPALGDLTLDRCREWRKKSKRLISANARNVTMFRACARCPVNKGTEDEQ